MSFKCSYGSRFLLDRKEIEAMHSLRILTSLEFFFKISGVPLIQWLVNGIE